MRRRIERTRTPRRRFRSLGIALLLFLVGIPNHAKGQADSKTDAPTSKRPAQSFEECQTLYRQGHYEACLESARLLVRGRPSEEWVRLIVECLMATGEHPQAQHELEAALARDRWSIGLRLLAHNVFRRNGRPDRAMAAIQEIQFLVTRYGEDFRDAESFVIIGQAAIILGEDAKLVLEHFFDKAKTARPELREVYLASGNLALSKNDGAVAAASFSEGIKRFPDDPELHFGMVRALADSDSKRATESLERTLEINPRYVPALLFRADNFIDRENYAQAEVEIGKALAVDRWNPTAWAMRSALAELFGDEKHAAAFRTVGLKHWLKNPEVDHVIGTILSHKYRFREGAIHQWQALAADPDFLPAKVQLSQDLLRLGQDADGWKLASEAFERDGYNVLTYNLVSLNDALKKYRTIEDKDFVVRMASHEADVYGRRVLELLHRAKDLLGEKYGLKLNERVAVEIFSRQSDFAVRTFGLPGGSGYLGVCFGRVITANSPSALPQIKVNWQSVLWHEYCHVVTLELTRNKMPRWLSEGISVYEERQADPSWGEQMTPQYREMILSGKLTPIGALSGAFLSPPSPLHLQFAYYESSLVVEYLVNQFGNVVIAEILRDLAADMPINDAIERRTGRPLRRLERDFDDYARKLAAEYGAGGDWSPLPRRAATAEPLAWVDDILAKEPNHVAALREKARLLLAAEKTADAATVLGRLIELDPRDTGDDSSYAMLAKLQRRLGDRSAERAVLEQAIGVDNEAVYALDRLVDFAEAEKDWHSVVEYSERMLAIKPLRSDVYWRMGQALEEQRRHTEAIEAYRNVLRLAPLNPAQAHFRLARLLVPVDRTEAKDHVIRALEEAPRFRPAFRLLLDIAQLDESAEAPDPATEAAAGPDPVSKSNKSPPKSVELTDAKPPGTPASSPAEANNSEIPSKETP